MKKYPSQSEEWNAVIDHTIFFMKSFVNISYDNKKNIMRYTATQVTTQLQFIQKNVLHLPEILGSNPILKG
jgi:hypothetical protein